MNQFPEYFYDEAHFVSIMQKIIDEVKPKVTWKDEEYKNMTEQSYFSDKMIDLGLLKSTLKSDEVSRKEILEDLVYNYGLTVTENFRNKGGYSLDISFFSDGIKPDGFFYDLYIKLCGVAMNAISQDYLRDL